MVKPRHDCRGFLLAHKIGGGALRELLSASRPQTSATQAIGVERRGLERPRFGLLRVSCTAINPPQKKLHSTSYCRSAGTRREGSESRGLNLATEVAASHLADPRGTQGAVTFEGPLVLWRCCRHFASDTDTRHSRDLLHRTYACAFPRRDAH